MKLHVINNIRTPFRQDNYLLLYQRYWPLKMQHVSIPKGHHQARINKKEGSHVPRIVICFLQLYMLQLLFFGGRGDTVVKVLCYKSEGRWFDPSWCHWNFSLT